MPPQKEGQRARRGKKGSEKKYLVSLILRGSSLRIHLTARRKTGVNGNSMIGKPENGGRKVHEQLDWVLDLRELRRKATFPDSLQG